MKKIKCLSTLLRIVTIALAIIAPFSKPSLAADKSATIEKHNLSLPTPWGPLLVNLSIKLGADKVVTLTGEVTNGTDRAWRIVSFEPVLLDKDGNKISRDISDSIMDGPLSAFSLAKSGTSPLLSILGQPFTFREVSWKKVSDLRLQYNEVYSHFDYRYVFTLVKPSLSQDLTYEDELVGLQFSVEDNGIHFSLQNKADSALVLDWDKASYVDFSGQSHRVIHTGVRLMDRDKSQASTLIPPTARIEDEFFPVDNISWESGIGERVGDWTQAPLIQPTKDPVGYKGGSFSIYFPLKVGDKEKNYLFTILIQDVVI